MRIEYHYDIDQNGNIYSAHFIETESGKYPQFTHPQFGADPVDVMHIIKGFHDGTIPIAGSGWELPSAHPDYQGKNCLEVLVAEIVRRNDVPARQILGV